MSPIFEETVSHADIDNANEVLDWLASVDLKSLIPVFEREQLTDWKTIQKLSIPLLQSLNIPLGSIFKLETALKGLPDK